MGEWLNRHERVTVSVLGMLAAASLVTLLWQRRKPPVTIEGMPAAVEAPPWDQALRRAGQVDVNTATIAELERLPQVGPALARRIVEYRQGHGPFLRSEELSRVKGVGPTTYEALRDRITTN